MRTTTRARAVRLATAAATLAAVFAVPASSAAAAACPAPIPPIAHRGGLDRYPENSRNAFRHSANVGVLMWETDLRLTADGQWRLMHDDTLNRTTNVTGPIAGYTAAQLDAGVRLTDGQEIPTLDELMNDAAVDGATVLLEPKIDPTAGQWASLLAAVDRYRWRHHTILMSFDPAVALEAKAVAPPATGIRTGLIAEPGYVPVSELTKYGSIYNKQFNSITGARLDEWSGPLEVYAWTPGTRDVWDWMNWYTAEPGRLDGVVTNWPQAYLAWARARVC